MKKLLLLIFLIPLMAWSQESEPKKNPVYMNFTVGASIPVGKSYPAIDTMSTVNSKAGYASTGMYLSAAVAFMGKNDLGIGFQYLYQKNNLKDDAQHIHIPDDTSYHLGSGSWTNHWIMGGMFFVHQENKLIIEGQILGGVVFSFSPVYSLYNPYSKRTEEGAGIGLGFGINAGIGYEVTPKVTVKVSVGYLNGYPTRSKEYPSELLGYDTISLNPLTLEPVYSAPVSYDIKKVISTFNIGAGIIIKI